jgi:hypothetical protein
MSERYTRKDAEACFHRLRRVLGKADLAEFPEITDQRRDGAWSLDYGTGGYVVASTIASSPIEGHEQTYTAESRPLGDRRRSAREFCEAVWFAIDAIAQVKHDA